MYEEYLNQQQKHMKDLIKHEHIYYIRKGRFIVYNSIKAHRNQTRFF